MKHSAYNEKKRHGSALFPIQYYYVDKHNPQYVMKAHWHKEFEIIRIITGKFHTFINHKEYVLNQGDVLLVEGGCLHRGEPTDAVYECIVFDLKMLIRQQNNVVERFVLPLLNDTATINTVLYHQGSEIAKTIELLCQSLHNKKEYYELEVFSLLFHLLAQIYESGAVSTSKDSNHTQQQKIIMGLLSWIEDNYTESITLKTLSDLSGFNPKYLCRIFKDYTSKTPINYINELRVEHACYEIAVKGKNVTRAAFDSGFNELSYFCRIFKHYKGITANEYKKQNTGKH